MNGESNEKFIDKLIRKTKADPLVPIFSLVTLGCLISGMRAFHTGQTNKSQMMMRARVVAQGVTIAALAFGAYMGVKPHNRPTTMEEVMTRRSE